MQLLFLLTVTTYPSLGGDIPCFYKPVTCGSPPSVENVAILNMSNKNNIHSALDTIDYSCNEGFKIEGNKTVSCIYSWEWSTPPKYSLNSICHQMSINVNKET